MNRILCACCAALLVASTLFLASRLNDRAGNSAPGVAHASTPNVLQFEPNPIIAALQRMRQADGYSFTSDIIQTRAPFANASTVGQRSRITRYRMEGSTETEQETVALRLWSESGNLIQQNTGVEIKVEKGIAYRREGTDDWRELEGAATTYAPQEGFLTLLRDAADIRSHPPETKAGILYTRHEFTIDAIAYARWQRDQLNEAFRARGELPPGVSLDVPESLLQAEVSGELWVGADGLPIRQILVVHLPEGGDGVISLKTTTDFHEFAGAPIESAAHGALGSALLAGTASIPARLGDPFVQGRDEIAALFVIAGFAVVLIRFGRSRVLYRAIAVALIVSFIGGPLLSTIKQVQFIDAVSARIAANALAASASALEADSATAPDSAMAVADAASPNNLAMRRAASLHAATEPASPQSLRNIAPLAVSAAPMTLADPNQDSDGDGLSDAQEAMIGTQIDNPDSDGDLVPDGLEIQGYTFGGQIWYADPTMADTNRDGIADGLEWGPNDIPIDTDGDGVPDFYDDDNDGDGVPDRMDLSPFTRSAQVYSDANPLALSMQNLEPGIATFVDFQIRPQNPDHLWYAFSVLDWPFDDQGQIRDVDGATFADYAAMSGASVKFNDAWGDTRVVPLLEIETPGNAAFLPSPAELAPYGISVVSADAQDTTKLIYLPVNIMTDADTGEQVAFSARMFYKMPTSAWPTAHKVRLVWMVQVLVDERCEEGEEGCAVGAGGGYRLNVPRVIKVYPDEWNLTGLRVTQDYGASMALAYEPPQPGLDVDDVAQKLRLSVGLDNAFLSPRDQDGNSKRDLSVSEITRRFDSRNNGGVSAQERWGLDNTFHVDQRDYATLDSLVASVSMTETKRVLNTVFAARWQQDNSFKPLVLIANESSASALGMGEVGYVQMTGAQVTVDMHPPGKEKRLATVTNSVKWGLYCAPANPLAQNPNWAECDMNTFLEEIKTRYTGSTALGVEALNSTSAKGRLAGIQLYALTLSLGATRSVQYGNTLLDTNAIIFNDTQLTSWMASVQLPGRQGVANIMEAIVAENSGGEPALTTWEYLAEFDFVQPVLEGIGIVPAFFKDPPVNPKVGGAMIVACALVLSFMVLFSVANTLDPAARKTMLMMGLVMNMMLATASTIVAAVGLAIDGVKYQPPSTAGAACAIIGAVVAVLATWALAIVSIFLGGIGFLSPAFNQTIADTIASTWVTISLSILALVPIGGLVVALLYLIDYILGFICEAVGETAQVMDGECVTIVGFISLVVSRIIYNQHPLVDLDHAGLLQYGVPRFEASAPEKLFLPGEPFSMTLPVTTTVIFKDPDLTNGLYILPYMWFYSKGTLRRSTFVYSLTREAQSAPIARPDAMAGEWAVSERRPEEGGPKWAATQMWRGEDTVELGPLQDLVLQPGRDQTIPATINMAWSIPLAECIWVPPYLTPLTAFPICWIRDDLGARSMPFDSFKVDVLPTTLDAFLTGGMAVWPDQDGDSLVTRDPNPFKWDADGDGLSDAFEIANQTQNASCQSEPTRGKITLKDGPALLPQDELTDKQERFFGTNAKSFDTDKDGLLDSDEVWHDYYVTPLEPTNGVRPCARFGEWRGGWMLTINDGVNPSFQIRVQSDPNKLDTDGDGLSDRQEYELRTATDANGYPYHPRVPNVAPVTLTTEISDADGLFAPGQSFVLTSTVSTGIALNPSPLQIAPPLPLLGGVGVLLGFTGVAAETLSDVSTIAIPSDTPSGIYEIEVQFTGNLSAGGSLSPIVSTESIRVDAAPPTSTITSLVDGQFVQAGSPAAPITLIVGGTAEDNEAGVALVEVSVNGGAWQTAQGTTLWAFPLELAEANGTPSSGQYQIRTRATDLLGNAETPGVGITIHADGTPPILGIPDPGLGFPVLQQWQAPRRAADGLWEIDFHFSTIDPTLGSTVNPSSGIDLSSVLFRLRSTQGATDPADDHIASMGWLTPTLVLEFSPYAQLWRLHTPLPAGMQDPTGEYVLEARAADAVGNVGSHANLAFIRLDARAPRASLNYGDVLGKVVTTTLSMSGVISDGVSLAGIDSAQALLMPLEEALAQSGAIFDLRFDQIAGTRYFEDDSGLTAGVACPAASVSCPASGAQGIRDRAIHFNGAAGEGPLVHTDADALNFDADTSISVEVWFKTPRVGTSAIVDKFGAYRLLIDSSGRAAWMLAGGSQPIVTGGPTLHDNNWHHLVATMDPPTRRASLYVDGVLVNSIVFGAAGALISGDPLTIGGDLGAFVPFAGDIDQLTIYNRALAADEVASNHAAMQRQWTPVALSPRGSGVNTGAWSMSIPAGLEGQFQLDLRANDLVGHRGISANLWRGIIDTRAPRVVLNGTLTGASIYDPVTGVQRYEVAYVCGAQDLFLDAESVVCPGANLPEPVRSFDDNPILEALLPDLTMRTGLLYTWTVWEPGPQIARTARACDDYGHCATATINLAPTPPIVAAPVAMVTAPTDGSVIAMEGPLNVTIVAESAQPLKEVTLSLDGVVVNTTAYAQAENLRRTSQTVVVPIATQGTHTLVARATDWAGTVQSVLYPVTLNVDTEKPTITVNTTPLGPGDTWQAGSGVLRLHGTVTDSLCLASVRVSVDGRKYLEALIEGNTWRVAYWVNAPEGRTLDVSAIATDCAGQEKEELAKIVANLSSPGAPDTRILSGPPAITPSTNAQLSFEGIAGSNELVGLQCRLDDGLFTSCESPHSLSGLAGGAHTFSVRAVDANGNVDPTPAVHEWRIGAEALAATITSGPPQSTNSRSATLQFSGAADVRKFECSLDGAAFAQCTAPRNYLALGNGGHTFRVRGVGVTGNRGAPASHAWTVTNVAPVVTPKSITTYSNTPVQVTLEASDANDDTIVYTLAAQPQHGTLSGSAPAVTYRSAVGYVGSDTIRYFADDGHGGRTEGVVSITVIERPAEGNTGFLPLINR